LLAGWVAQGVAQRPWGVEEDLALLMHFRVRVSWWFPIAWPDCSADVVVTLPWR
jgi:hypothetical protein